MQIKKHARSLLRILLILCAMAALLFGSFGACTYSSWARDAAVLQEVARREIEGHESVPQQLSALNSYVYRAGGFAKNNSYYLIRRLGPTPIQVLQTGGDCSDKSRLLAAMLAQLDIPSTLVMLYPCETCPAGHTVVEARYGNDSIALDPVYDIVFPDPRGGLLGLAELSQDYQAVVDHIIGLRVARGPNDKINGYDYEQNSYRHVRTVNWDKNWATKRVGTILGFLGYEPFLVSRPRLLEDPKLFLSFGSALLCLFSIALAGVCWPATRGKLT